MISLWGDNRLSVNDGAGNFTGVTPDGWIVNDIPLASFDPGEGGTFASFPITATYTISIEQQSNDPLMVRVTEFRNSLDGEMLTPFQRANFVDVPSVISGTATMALDYSAGLSTLQLIMDFNNDGIPDQVITPTSVLDQDGIGDIVPPTTTIAIEGNQDAWGFYTGSVTITLSAQDGPDGMATGVLKTEYSLDGGESWLVYTGPINMVAEAVPVLQARSVDRGGNQEYPFTSQRLRPYVTFLPSLIR
jgi:hypothetical protein